MSDDKTTENKPQADGTDCPAAQPLCLCGVRGCKAAEAHALQANSRVRVLRPWQR